MHWSRYTKFNQRVFVTILFNSNRGKLNCDKVCHPGPKINLTCGVKKVIGYRSVYANEIPQAQHVYILISRLDSDRISHTDS